jgi:hypothetical protein
MKFQKVIWGCKKSGSHSVAYETFYILGYNVCNSLKVNGRFGGTCNVYLQDRRNIMKQAASKFHAASLFGLLFDPVDRGDIFIGHIGSISMD